jgi:small GTP-binding protein
MNKEEGEKDYIIDIDNHEISNLGFKMILLGEAAVGKSSILMRSTKNIYEDYYSATVGFDFATLNIRHHETIIKLQIWDTCGQEVYRSLITSFYKDASLAILVYAIDE